MFERLIRAQMREHSLGISIWRRDPNVACAGGVFRPMACHRYFHCLHHLEIWSRPVETIPCRGKQHGIDPGPRDTVDNVGSECYFDQIIHLSTTSDDLVYVCSRVSSPTICY